VFQNALKPKNGKNSIRELHLVGHATFDQRLIGSVATGILSPKQVDDYYGSKKDEIIALVVLVMTSSGNNVESIFELLRNKHSKFSPR
jgi:hypothetical protein